MLIPLLYLYLFFKMNLKMNPEDKYNDEHNKVTLNLG